MAGNPFKLEFTLKQHTPLIHFQHDQEGATLRATELKPKLDRFIVEHVFHNQFEKAKKYLVGYPFDDTSEKGHRKVEELRGKFEGEDKFRALDYKINKIHGVLRNTEDRGVIPIIGNNTTWIWFQSVAIEMTFFNIKLKEKIESIISDFFILSRFGKRQSKGFGQFTLSGSSDYNLIVKTICSYNKDVYSKKADENSIVGTNREIDSINRWLKSGVNKPYEKAPSFLYAIERARPLRWDKRLLKRAIQTQDKFQNNSLLHKIKPINLSEGDGEPYEYENDYEDFDEKRGFNPLYDDKTEYRFVRALLGLAEHYEFLVSENADRKFVATVKSEGNKIERFQSPVTFRFFDGFIIVTAERIPSEMFNQNFYFELKMKENRIYDDEIIENLLEYVSFDPHIKTPSQVEFSLPTFLKKYLPKKGFKIISNAK